jgi:hypothetical protein
MGELRDKANSIGVKIDDAINRVVGEGGKKILLTEKRIARIGLLKCLKEVSFELVDMWEEDFGDNEVDDELNN